MADYRSWCSSCGAEINFGGHKDGCALMAQERQAFLEQREFESELNKKYDTMPEEDFLDEAETLYREMSDLASILSAKERKWKYFKQTMLLRDGNLREKLAERVGNRYL